MAKLLNALGMLSLATMLASGGFVGYLVGSGRLNAPRWEKIAAVLRGELDTVGEPPAAEQPQPVARQEPTTTAPARSSAGEVQARRQREELESLRLEAARTDLQAQRRLLDQVMQHIVQEQERLDQERSAFAEQRKKLATAALDEGFQKELDYVSGLKPAQAKEYIVRVWQRQKADAVRLFAAIDESRGKRILEQFKTPDELQIMTDLLEQIRLYGVEGDANPSGRTAGAAAP